MCDIDKIMDMLDSGNEKSVQLRGIEMARSINSINVFLQPANPGHVKDVWENCAKILVEKPEDILQPYLFNLLEWLQDINWPGAFIIADRLKSFSGEKLAVSFSDAVKLAMTELYGEMWLVYLSGLLENKELRELLAPDVLDLLCKHYNNFWGNSEDLFR